MKEKNGFTLIELLVVISIVAIASVSSIIVFDSSDSDTKKENLEDTYVKIQRAAKIYMEMNDSWRNQFNDNKYIFLRISELEEQNFIEEGIADPTTYDEIPSNYFVKINLLDRTEGTNTLYTVDSCIVDIVKDASGNEHYKCIANSSGVSGCGCCGEFDSTYNPHC